MLASGFLLRLMLPYHQNSVPQSEPLAGISSNCGIKGRVPDRYACRRGDDPTNVLVVWDSTFRRETATVSGCHVGSDWQFAQELIDAKIKLRRTAPTAASRAISSYSGNLNVTKAVQSDVCPIWFST